MKFLFAPVSALALFAAGCAESPGEFDAASSLQAEVSGAKAFEHVEALVGFGPRPAGSEALEASRQYIEKRLTDLGWQVRRQTFTAKTPEGRIEFTNLRSRFGEAPKWDGGVAGLLASHYDTKLYEGFEFVGANDAGSSTGLLIELARVLSLKENIASRLELVFFDGEEAFGPNITPTDGLYGSKHYAGEMLEVPERKRPKWGLLLDMVGDEDLKIRAGVRIPRASLRELIDDKDSGYRVDVEALEAARDELARRLLNAADDLEFRSYVGISSAYIVDDHVPLNVSAGIPTIDLIDFDYRFWHTPGDTLDKISPRSLEISGRVTMQLVERYLVR
ncbi:MAG: M28 family peptidase [Verrucomicrobiales bacterium]